MSSGESGAKFASHLKGGVVREASDAAEQGAEILAINVFHGKIRQTCDLADVIHTAHVGMRYLASDANFVVKAPESCRIRHGGFGQEFQRYLLAEPQIGGAINFTHAAAAEQSDDAIAVGYQCSGKESSFVDRTRALRNRRGCGARGRSRRHGHGLS